ncbi:MAG: copper amine oxidase N-terminal domain-containing protein [Caldisericia bacterium]|nr:copper amine oxidase N-terminal domain-containing protein [Caldisericia bacterium]
MKKFAICILAAMMALAIVPFGTAKAAAAVNGRISGLDCYSGRMVVVYSSIGGTMNVQITDSTSISVNGAQASCSDLQIGMSVTVSGEMQDNILVASRVAATGAAQEQTFRLSGKVVSISCPSTLIVSTSYGTITFDISNANFTKNGVGASCDQIASGDTVIISGVKKGQDYIAQTVAAMASAETFSIHGTIITINCPVITVEVSGQSIDINVSSASILINGKPSDCSSLEPSMNVSVTGTKTGQNYVARQVNAIRPPEPFTISGKVSSINCSSGILYLSTSQGVLNIVVSSSSFSKNGSNVTCSDIKPGDTVVVTGLTDGTTYQAQTVDVTASLPVAFNITAPITTVNCPKITVKSSITISLESATILINGQNASCSDLKVGDVATINGTSSDGSYTANAVYVARASTDPTPDPDPPTTKVLTGIVKQIDCSSNVVIVSSNTGDFSLPLNISFTRDGMAATCADLVVGDKVTITYTVQDSNVTLKSIEFESTSGGGSGYTTITMQGEIVFIDCNAKMLNLKKSDNTVVVVTIDPSCLFYSNNSKVSCSDFAVGDNVTVYAKVYTSSGMTSAYRIAKTSSTDPEPPAEDVFKGYISSVDCLSQRITIKIDPVEYPVDISAAAIYVDGKAVSCTNLSVGMEVTITGRGDSSTGNIFIIAKKVDAKSTNSGCDNGVYSITGTVEFIDYINKVITIKIGSSYITVTWNDTTIFTVDGVTSTYDKILKGDTVTVNIECSTNQSMIAKTVNKKTSSSSTTNTISGTILSIMCSKGYMTISGADGIPITIKLYSTTEFYLNGIKVTCSALIPGFTVTVTYTTDQVGYKVASKVEATTPTSGGGSGGGSSGGGTGGGSSGGTPPQPPPGTGSGGGSSGGGSSGGGSGSSGSGSSVKSGDPYQSVVTVESFDCASGTIKGADEYNSGTKVEVNLTSEGGFWYKQEKIDCDRVKPGYLVKIVGKYGSSSSKINAESIEVLPVSPVSFSVIGRVVEVNTSTGIVKLEKITTTQSQDPIIMSTAGTSETFTVKIDPTTTFDYRGEKLTIKDLRAGIIMNVEGLLDPVNSFMTTNNFALSARQATAVTQTGTVADVFCDKNLFWISLADKPDSKYVLIRLSAETDIQVNGSKATCSDIVKGATVTINGKLDPFDLFVTAESIESEIEKAKSSTVEGEVVSVDTDRSFLWIKIDDANGIRYIQVFFTAETKILFFGKAGTASDLATAGMVSITGLADTANAFIFNATTIETTGKISENLTASGTVVFTDCSSKVLFVKTSAGVERFELTTTTKLLAGDKIASCTDIKEGAAVTLVYDKKGTKTFVTKITLPAAKTIIKLTVGLGAMSINGKNQLIDAPPYIKNGTTMVPLRVVTEALNASVSWNQSDKRITIQKGSKVIICWIGRTDALVGGLSTTISQAPEQDKSGRTMVPIRFMSELFGAEVLWDQASKTITITM